MNALNPLRILLVTSLVVVLAPAASALGVDISANVDASGATDALAGVQGTATGLVGEAQAKVQGELDGALGEANAAISADAPDAAGFVDKAKAAFEAAFQGIAAFAQGLAARVDIGASA